MLKTYTFYVIGRDGEQSFQPMLCRADSDALARAREILEANPDHEAIDVCFGETHLFRVTL